MVILEEIANDPLKGLFIAIVVIILGIIAAVRS